MTLVEEAATFLEADGWTVARRDGEIALVTGKRAGFGDASDQVLVWCPPATLEPEALRRHEPMLLRRFAEEARAPGQKFLLVDSREGFSQDFLRDVRREYDINIRVPVQFFDTPFKSETSSLSSSGAAAATAAGALRQRGVERARLRTPQPFKDVASGRDGKDLLTELRKRFESPVEWASPVILVTAPAGFGKSVLFESLYARLYEDFIAAKRQLQIARRPLPLLPEYVASAAAPTLRGLVEAFLQTDVARPVRLRSFEWMLRHGYASWVLDGLDEVISQDPNFFEYILDVLTQPDAPATPRVLICVRDSLLSASQGLRDFVAEAGNLVSECRLLPWKEESLQTFAKMRLTSKVSEFLSVIGRRPALQHLCGTPYYAELLASRIDEHRSAAAIDTDLSEINLLDQAVESIINREYDKGLMSRAVVSTEDILELIREVAVMELQSTTQGVSIDEITELASILLPADLDEADRSSTLNQMQHLSVFRSTLEEGQVRFAQDVVFEFLVGRRAVEWLRSNPPRFLQLLGWRPLPPDSLVLRVLKAEIESVGSAEEIHGHLVAASASPAAFRNLLQLTLLLDSPSRLLQQVPLERQDLSGIRFVGLELTGVSLRGANLESAEFADCNLADVNLAEATLHATRFEGCRGLARAQFGGLSGFISVTVDSTHIDSVDEFMRCAGLKTNIREVVVGPCLTAMQLRHLFLKFVRPDGQARRDWLDERGVLAGKRFVDPAGVVEAATHDGFLTWDPVRRRYERNRGQLYADMVSFAKNLQITSAISTLLHDTCRIPGCPHLIELSATGA